MPWRFSAFPERGRNTRSRSALPSELVYVYLDRDNGRQVPCIFLEGSESRNKTGSSHVTLWNRSNHEQDLRGIKTMTSVSTIITDYDRQFTRESTRKM